MCIHGHLRPFRLLKKRVANIFTKRTLILGDIRGTSTQSIINCMERDSEERSIINNSKRSIVHSDWSDLILVDEEAEYWMIQRPNTRPNTSTVPSAAPVVKTLSVPSSFTTNTHKAVKNIVLVPYTPKPNEWGSWQVKRSQLTSGTNVSPNSAYSKQEQDQEQEEDIRWVYQPQSPYYSPVHPPEFYNDE